MTAPIQAPAPRVPAFLAGLYGGNTRSVVARGMRVVARNNWLIILTGFFEPVF